MQPGGLIAIQPCRMRDMLHIPYSLYVLVPALELCRSTRTEWALHWLPDGPYRLPSTPFQYPAVVGCKG
jgi:hypothetical protein